MGRPGPTPTGIRASLMRVEVAIAFSSIGIAVPGTNGMMVPVVFYRTMSVRYNNYPAVLSIVDNKNKIVLTKDTSFTNIM